MSLKPFCRKGKSIILAEGCLKSGSRKFQLLKVLSNGVIHLLLKPPPRPSLMCVGSKPGKGSIMCALSSHCQLPKAYLRCSAERMEHAEPFQEQHFQSCLTIMTQAPGRQGWGWGGKTLELHAKALQVSCRLQKGWRTQEAKPSATQSPEDPGVIISPYSSQDKASLMHILSKQGHAVTLLVKEGRTGHWVLQEPGPPQWDPSHLATILGKALC